LESQDHVLFSKKQGFGISRWFKSQQKPAFLGMLVEKPAFNYLEGANKRRGGFSPAFQRFKSQFEYKNDFKHIEKPTLPKIAQRGRETKVSFWQRKTRFRSRFILCKS
jgi:hypothetical protein